MRSLVIDLIGGLILASITGILAFLYGRTSFTAGGILHKNVRTHTRSRYHFLEGRWNDYYTSSFDESAPPVWMKGSLILKCLRNGTFRGKFIVDIYDSLTLGYSVRGEVRGGWLIYVGVCDDTTDTVFTGIFPNILTGSTLVGLWTGQDNARQLVTGPIVISRHSLNVQELNKIVSNAKLNVIWPDAPTRMHPPAMILKPPSSAYEGSNSPMTE